MLHIILIKYIKYCSRNTVYLVTDKVSENGLVHPQVSAEKRREAKGKGKEERQTHLNAEFQRIARRDKKVFLSDQ